MLNSPNSPNSPTVYSPVYSVSPSNYKVKPGNDENTVKFTGEGYNMINKFPQTPKKQKPVAYGKPPEIPKTPSRQTFKVAYGGKRKTRSKRRSSRKTIRRRN